MSKARGPYRVDPLGYKKANEALDKMAENARELGLDYEPVWDNLPSNKDVEDAMRLKRLSQLAEKPAQQEKDWGAVGEAHIAAIKKSSKATVEDAVVRAVHKVMAEFEAKSDERLMGQPAQQEPVKREHITDDSSCWCEPETIYKDPETGVSVIVHKEPQ